MYSKILCVVALAVAVSGQAAQFPAGVDPALCPSYPNCDNAYLHNPQGQQQQQWNAPAQQQQWNAPQQQWNKPAEDWTQWDEPSNGAWSGEQNQQDQWNAPAQNQWNAPAQNQWNAPQQNQWNAQPQNQWNVPAVQGPSSNHLPGAGGDKYPAGVNPQQCPNYPYCDSNLSAGHGQAQVAPLPGWTERVYPAGVNPQSCPNYPLCN